MLVKSEKRFIIKALVLFFTLAFVTGSYANQIMVPQIKEETSAGNRGMAISEENIVVIDEPGFYSGKELKEEDNMVSLKQRSMQNEVKRSLSEKQGKEKSRKVAGFSKSAKTNVSTKKKSASMTQASTKKTAVSSSSYTKKSTSSAPSMTREQRIAYEQRRAEQILSYYIKKYPILAGVKIYVRDCPNNWEGCAYYTKGIILVDPDHKHTLEEIIAHEVRHIIDWREDNKIDYNDYHE